MELEQVSVRLLAKDAHDLPFERAIAALHAWIREQVGTELLIDVADYRHVPAGPGLMVIADKGLYALELRAGVVSAGYSRRRDQAGPAGGKVREALSGAIRLAARLEKAGLASFASDAFEVRVLSRRVLPSSAKASEILAGLLVPIVDSLFGGPRAELAVGTHDLRAPATVRVGLASVFSTKELAARIAH